MHDGIPFVSVPVTATDYLGPDGGHLNARGNDQVMADLAVREPASFKALVEQAQAALK